MIDDDPAVHDGTRFALADYKLNGQGFDIVSAYSAAEGRELMRQHLDVAVVLLDVIMESDTAGLELVDFIRNDLKNETVRIILRTGQPGQAPERRVIVDYDINDYKAKTELTADKLFTSLTAALRSYQQLAPDGGDPPWPRNHHRGGLDPVRFQVDATAGRRRADPDRVVAERELCGNPGAARGAEFARALRAGGIGMLQPLHRHRRAGMIDHDLKRLVAEAFTRRQHEFSARRSVIYIKTMSGREVVVVLEAARKLSETDRALVEIFCSRLSIAFDNVILYEQLQAANAGLEERVTQRTQDLTAANRRLAAQWARLRQANSFKSEIRHRGP